MFQTWNFFVCNTRSYFLEGPKSNPRATCSWRGCRSILLCLCVKTRELFQGRNRGDRFYRSQVSLLSTHIIRFVALFCLCNLLLFSTELAFVVMSTGVRTVVSHTMSGTPTVTPRGYISHSKGGKDQGKFS